ncbi:MAG: PDZ domain-containing protein, partial [Gammaproteobacteria bacterium]|nr:PDZ domain-containing protein [Gammaproteobacteria bacterium]
GVQIQPVTSEMAEALGAKAARGALVAAVMDKSPAARAGVQVGDVILAFDAKTIQDARDLSKAVAAAEPGSKVRISILRDGHERELSTVVDRNAQDQVASNDAAPKGDAAGSNRLAEELGVALGPVSPEARQQLNLSDDVKGALVVGVKGGSAADDGGLKPGDIIVRVNRGEVADPQAAQRALVAARDDKRPVVVLVRRGEQQFFTSMKLG